MARASGRVSWRLQRFIATVCLILAGAVAACGQSNEGTNARPTDEALRAQAFRRFYNLDYDRAIPAFQKLLDRHPEDPNAVNHLLAAVMYRELYRMGLLNP